MILADTSAWVEYDRGTGSATALRLRGLIADGGGELATAGPIVMEMLAGAGDDVGVARLRRFLASFSWLSSEPLADFEGAAKIYRACRAAGATPRGLTDCMIANIAMRTGAEVLAVDRDFSRIAGVVPLKIASAS